MMLQFTDQAVPYDVFVRDVAKSVVRMLSAQSEPQYVSQNEAYRRFGRSCVDRWRKQGKIEPCIRPGKVEYSLAELHSLQEAKQDYFT